MPSSGLRLERLLTLGLWACLLFSLPTVVWGQAPAEPELSPPPPALTLTEPTLAQRSLAGPVVELVAGSVVVVSTPLVAAIAAFLVGPELFCGGFDGAEHDSPTCAAQQEHGRKVGIGVGVAMGVVGLGLVAHGAYRTRQIRLARRALSHPVADFELDRHGAALRLRWRF